MLHNLRSLLFLSCIVGFLMKTVKYNFDDDTCEIQSFVINTEKDIEQLSQFAEYSSINFKWPTMSTMSSILFAKLAALNDLKIDRGKVLTVEIVPQLEHLQLDSCQTIDLIVNPAQEYKLKSLIVWKTPLAELPKNITYLKQLNQLDLSDNQIEFINLDKLSGLLKLRSLHLNSNKIKRLIHSSQATINLPSLELIYLHENQLTNLSFENWNATSVRHLHLHRNRIPMAVSVLSAFPVLRDVRIHDNPLFCVWKNFLVEELLARNVKIYKEDELKCLNTGEIDAKLEIFSYKMWRKSDELWRKLAYLHDDLKQSYKNANYQIVEEIRKLNYTISASIHVFNNKFNENEKQFLKLEANVTQLFHKNHDLTEYFYQFALEHIDDHLISVETQIKQEDKGLNWQQQQSQLNQIEQNLQKIEAKQNALIENLRKISLLSVLMSNVSKEN
uniref:Matrix-remodeling-associated protein 5 n=2 Tax=Culex pipiens TaxID=7175 RepID=A0A8D8DJH3_CULPI